MHKGGWATRLPMLLMRHDIDRMGRKPAHPTFVRQLALRRGREEVGPAGLSRLGREAGLYGSSLSDAVPDRWNRDAALSLYDGTHIGMRQPCCRRPHRSPAVYRIAASQTRWEALLSVRPL